MIGKERFRRTLHICQPGAQKQKIEFSVAGRYGESVCSEFSPNNGPASGEGRLIDRQPSSALVRERCGGSRGVIFGSLATCAASLFPGNDAADSDVLILRQPRRPGNGGCGRPWPRRIVRAKPARPN